MKTIYNILLILMLIGIAMIGIGLLIGNGNIKVTNIFNNDSQYEKHKLILDQNVVDININVDDRHIEILESESKESYIEYYLNDKTDKISFATNNSEFTFKLKQKNWGLFNFSLSSKKVREVKIYLTKLEKLDILVSSGSVLYDYNKITENIKIKTYSGAVNILNANVTELMSIDIESGKFTGNNIFANNFFVETTSGRIEINNSKVNQTTNIKSTSGSVNITDLTTNKLDVGVTSGSIRLNNSNSKNTVLKSLSGSIRIIEKRLKEDIGFQINVFTGSINFYGSRRKEVIDQIENYSITYKIDVTSGSVNISN